MSDNLLKFLVSLATSAQGSEAVSSDGMQAFGLSAKEQEVILSRDTAALEKLLAMHRVTLIDVERCFSADWGDVPA